MRQPANRLLAQFGDKVVSYKKKCGLTQIELASLLGVSRVTITNIETGQNATTIEGLLKLCAVFKCTPTDLLPAVPKMTIDENGIEKTIVVKTFKGSFEWE